MRVTRAMSTTHNYLNTRLVGILRTKPQTPKDNAVNAIQSAFDAGAQAIEITSNSDFWQGVVKECISRNLNVGVGSVKNTDTAKEALSLGARFLVSPGLFPQVIAIACEKKIPMLPGVYLESEIKRAKTLNVSDQKFFPANVKTHEELYKAISEPFRDEFEDLKKKNWTLIAYDSNEFLSLGKKTPEYIEVTSPTEFYEKYLILKDEKPYCPIVIKLPDDNNETGFSRVKTFSELSKDWEIRTYAVGGVNDKNIKEVLTKYNAYGVCPGSGMFNGDAIFKGDFERVKTDVRRHVEVVKEIFG